MGRSMQILAVCRQPLKNVQHAVRAYNIYKQIGNLGVKVIYLDDWSPSFKIRRLRNVMNWLKIVFFKHISKNNSWLFVENVQSPLVAQVFRKIGMPVVLDIRDDLNLHASSMDVRISSLCSLEREYAQASWFDLAERIIVTSPSYAEYYSQKHQGHYDSKILVIMNASDPSRFLKRPLPEEFRLGILGGANAAEGFEILIEAVRIARKKFPRLSVQIGYKLLPETRPYMNSIKSRYREDWINYYNNINYLQNSPEFYSSLDICVIPRRKTLINELSTPSKLFDCMASARPLVVTNCKEQARIVMEEDCGLVCDAVPEDMAAQIVRLLQDPKLACRLGENGRRAVELRHNWRHRAEGILKAIRHSSGEREARP